MDSPTQSPGLGRRPSVRPRLKITLKGRTNTPMATQLPSAVNLAEGNRVRLTVTLPSGINGHQTVCEANEYDTLQQILESLCLRKGLPMDKFYLTVDTQGQRRIPLASENVHQTLTQHSLNKLNLVPKSVYSFTLTKQTSESHGYNVINEDPVTRQKGVFVWAIKAGSIIEARDLLLMGDRILEINDHLCSSITFDQVLSELRKNTVTLMVSSNRNMDDNQYCKPFDFDFEAAAEYRTIFMSITEIEAMGCPPVPSLSDPVDLSTISPVEPVSEDNQSPQKSTSISCMAASSSVCSDTTSDNALSLRTCTLVADCNKLCGHTMRENGKISIEEMRTKVLKEIIETERKYVSDLRHLAESYLEPLSAADWLTDDQKIMLLNNTYNLLAFHTQLLTDLDTAYEHEIAPVLSDMEKREFKSVASIILQHIKCFDLYSDYCLHYPEAFRLVETVINDPQRPMALDTFLRERNPHQEQSRTLESYLIKPVQRVLKYPLLMRELHSFTLPESADFSNVEQALSAIKEVNVKINEIKREQDNAIKAQDLFASADWGDETVSVARLGPLVYSGDVYISISKRDGEHWECFLFQHEILMFRKKERSTGPTYRLKERLLTDYLLVRDYDTDDGRQVWELVNAETSRGRTQPKSYYIECRTAEEKKYWMSKTKSVIKENILAKNKKSASPDFQRGMSIDGALSNGKKLDEDIDFLDFLKEASGEN
eukprot:CFRG8152T1